MLCPIADTPEDLARRDNAAIAQVASLRPVNADEISIAAQTSPRTPMPWIA